MHIFRCSGLEKMYLVFKGCSLFFGVDYATTAHQKDLVALDPTLENSSKLECSKI